MLRVSVATIRSNWPYASRPGISCRYRERGQAILETTICMILLLTLIFGIIEGAWAVYSYHFISEAAREGARYAIVRGSACTTFTSACPATAAQIQSYVTGLGYPGINTAPSAMTVTASWCGPSGSVPPACSTGTNAPGEIVRVAIVYKFPLQIPFVPANTITMNATSQMVISQ